MRDNFNFNMLPIVQDNMNYIPSVKSLTNLSCNGYYGYQPPLLQKHKEQEPQGPPVCFMEVQFESLQTGTRKRAWEPNNDPLEFKKRRQNESCSFIYQQPTPPPNRDAKLRKPTHNVPDMPRCIMENIDATVKKKSDEELFEELLKETHGSTMYHWISDGL